MKLASHLAKSRHGVFYFRLSVRIGGATREKRVSLRTKNPQEARLKAACLSGIMAVHRQEQQRAMAEARFNTAQGIAAQDPDGNFLLKLLRRVDPDRLVELTGRSLSEVNELLNGTSGADVRRLDIEMPGGFALRNVNSEDDASRAIQILKALNLSPEALATLITSNPNPAPAAPAQVAAPPSNTEQGGTTIQEMVPRFATRKKSKLSVKTLYEYGNYHRKFVDWLELRKKKKHIPIHSITRADIADFIDDLLAEGLTLRTITQKYIPAINGLFDLAKSIGLLPDNQEVVSRGHKVLSKADIKKSSTSTSYKAFSSDELKSIFHPQFLTNAARPVDFWAPLLALFTGARLNELCQLDVADIQQHDEIWAIHFIDNTPDKSLKSPAARRLIPISPTLIDCGFLDYVNDARQFGGGRKLFPYLTYSQLDGYAATPSERWGKYLDSLDIKDPQKAFHSFRSTANDCLKQNGVPEESRCQLVGHEHDTINSATYSNPHNLQFLLEYVASKLTYPALDFKSLKYQPGQFNTMLAQLCAKKESMARHKAANAKLGAKR